MGGKRPTVLFVYYSFTKQTELVVDAMAQEMTTRGCTMTKAPLEFHDAHYSDRFSQLPMSRPILNIVGMLVAQRRRKTGGITIPPEAQNGDYDLVVFGSPTWWLTTCMPVRSYLQSPAATAVLDGKPFAGVSVSRRYYKGNLGDIKKLGGQAGGTWSGGTQFVSDGNQVMSMASWLVFMRKNEPRRRYFGVPLPRPNLRRDYGEGAKRYADELADKVFGGWPVGTAS